MDRASFQLESSVGEHACEGRQTQCGQGSGPVPDLGVQRDAELGLARRGGAVAEEQVLVLARLRRKTRRGSGPSGVAHGGGAASARRNGAFASVRKRSARSVCAAQTCARWSWYVCSCFNTAFAAAGWPNRANSSACGWWRQRCAYTLGAVAAVAMGRTRRARRAGGRFVCTHAQSRHPWPTCLVPRVPLRPSHARTVASHHSPPRACPRSKRCTSESSRV